MSDAQPDKVRDALLLAAGSCLDHVRLVKWGDASSRYNVVEGDQVIEITVLITCNRKPDPANV